MCSCLTSLAILAALCVVERRVLADEPIASGAANLADSHVRSDRSARVTLEAGLLNVSARGVPLRELIARIGAVAGFDVIAMADGDEYIDSWSISGMSPNQAVEVLLRGASAVVVHGPSESNAVPGDIVTVYLLGTRSPGRSTTIQPEAEASGRLRALAPTRSIEILLDETRLQGKAERIRSIDRLIGLADDLTVRQLTFSLRLDPDPEVRRHAARAIADLGGELAATALETGLGDVDASVRALTVELLAGIDDERVTLWLGQMLMGDTHTDVRLAALEALAGRGDEMAASFLHAAGKDDSVIGAAAARFAGSPSPGASSVGTERSPPRR